MSICVDNHDIQPCINCYLHELFYFFAGITFPSGSIQRQLLLEVYNECCIDPSTVSYVEAHGTGTKAGDPQEVNTIADVFCKGRQQPLLIGSVKSNMGHSEPASGKTQILILYA